MFRNHTFAALKKSALTGNDLVLRIGGLPIRNHTKLRGYEQLDARSFGRVDEHGLRSNRLGSNSRHNGVDAMFFEHGSHGRCVVEVVDFCDGDARG